MDKESVSPKDLKHGHTLVGTTRMRLTELNLSTYKGILLRCPGSSDPNGGNTVPVYIGGPGVTANSSESTGGMPLIPGASLTIQADQAREIWLISSMANQDVAWMSL